MRCAMRRVPRGSRPIRHTTRRPSRPAVPPTTPRRPWAQSCAKKTVAAGIRLAARCATSKARHRRGRPINTAKKVGTVAVQAGRQRLGFERLHVLRAGLCCPLLGRLAGQALWQCRCKTDGSAFDTSTCTMCDPGVTTKECVTFGAPYTGGAATCNALGTDWNKAACELCGDNIKGSNEECDGTDTAPQTCADQQPAGGRPEHSGALHRQLQVRHLGVQRLSPTVPLASCMKGGACSGDACDNKQCGNSYDCRTSVVVGASRAPACRATARRATSRVPRATQGPARRTASTTRRAP